MDDLHFLFRKPATISAESSASTSEKMRSFLSNLALHCATRGHRVLLIGVTNDVDVIDPVLKRSGLFELEYEVPPPSRKDRFAILTKILQKMSINTDLPSDALSEVASRAHGYTPSDLITVCKLACSFSTSNQSNPSFIHNLNQALSRVKPTAMKEIVLDIPRVTWEQIGGQSELKNKLRQAIEWPIKFPERFEKFGIRPPRGVLLYGPPGCSKTMIAKALATETGLNFMSVKGPEIFDKYVGQSELAIRRMFQRARQAAPVIIFFDEIDVISASRGGGGSSSGNQVSDRVLTQLLTELDGVEQLNDVVIVAATNRPDIIDKALLRPGRIDKLIYVPLPDYVTRLQILKITGQKMPLSSDVVLTELSEKTDGYSGAEVCAVCDEAAMRALNNNADDVTMGDFLLALNNVRPQTTQDVLMKYEKFSNSAQ